MKSGYVFIAIATFLFSTMEIALKIISGAFNPVQMNLIRFTAGALLLLPMAISTLKKKGTRLGANDAAFFALTGFIGIVVSMSLYQVAVTVGRASIVAVIFSCNPVFMVPFAYLILKEKIRAFTVVSAAVSISGIVCIMNPAQIAGDQVFGSILLTVGSAAAFALFSVIGKTRAPRYGGVANTCFSFFAAGAEMLVLVALSWFPPVADFMEASGLGIFSRIPILRGVSSHNIAILAYASLCVTGLGYAAFFLAIEKTSAAVASLVFYIKPALAPVLALLVLGESLKANTIWGIALIVIGSAIAFIGNARLSKPAAAGGRSQAADGRR